MPQIHENPGAAATALEADHEAKHADFAACRAQNQATLLATFGIGVTDPYASQKIAALKRRGIFARHGVTAIPVICGRDPLGAAIEVPSCPASLDDVLGHLRFNPAAPEPCDLTPDHIDADFIGRLEPDNPSTLVLAVTVRDWLAFWRFAPSGHPDGRVDAWPGANFICRHDDRTLRRIAWRLAGSRIRVAVIGNGGRQRKVAEKLARMVVPPVPSIIRLAREVEP